MLRFAPCSDLEQANIVADGRPLDTTVLTLSHWPKSGTPWRLKADLSAEIVFRYLEHPELRVAAEIVTNNHFDEDGLVSVFALVDPGFAIAHRQLLEDVARAGDFGWSERREAARIASVVSAFADDGTSPLDPGVFALGYAERTARLYQELLPRLPEIVTKLDAHRRWWEGDDAKHEAGLRAMAAGS